MGALSVAVLVTLGEKHSLRSASWDPMRGAAWKCVSGAHVWGTGGRGTHPHGPLPRPGQVPGGSHWDSAELRVQTGFPCLLHFLSEPPLQITGEP